MTRNIKNNTNGTKSFLLHCITVYSKDPLMQLII
jgi:hypothetical protein